jgi:SAM-dependent methyltransferase
MKEPYSPADYWEKRLSDRLDVSTVGHASLGPVYNGWLYRERFLALRRALRGLQVSAQGKAVLEVGAGSGAYIPVWEKLGAASYTGVDITSASVSRLSQRYPRFCFLQADIGEPAPPDQGQYDIVTAFDVLFHIVDDAKFTNAIANLAAMVRPGGIAILSDGFCPNPWGPFYHEYHRSYSHYAGELRAAGLEPHYLAPIFFTMTTTLCEPERHRRMNGLSQFVMKVAGKLAARRATEWGNHVVGWGAYAVDGVLGRISPSGPSLKLLFARKGETKADVR